ncbi:MAG: 2-octaprenyl-6-methoxy-1,4-benzoquinone methylase [Dehalococcoidia bacterium]|nr:2-octaprenyl-6-methoxy-1,4-benzoquinone methylase [Dehalococcoidia bacterium]
MFGRIAGRYDMGNKVLSLGRDQAWRRRAVRLLNPLPNDVILDIGAGTADLSLQLAKKATTVVAGDFSLPMLEAGRHKVVGASLAQRIALVAADAMRLPFADNSFDGATAAFTMRNLADMDDGFAEILRVLKPGGRFVCLEFMKPRSGLVNFFYRPYLNHILPFLGSRVTGDRAAYAYLAASINAFSTPEELTHTMEAAGFRSVECHLINLATVAAHVGTKQPSELE